MTVEFARIPYSFTVCFPGKCVLPWNHSFILRAAYRLDAIRAFKKGNMSLPCFFQDGAG